MPKPRGSIPSSGDIDEIVVPATDDLPFTDVPELNA